MKRLLSPVAGVLLAMAIGALYVFVLSRGGWLPWQIL